MFKNPEDIANKALSQHFLEHLLIDLAVAPAERLLILLQTQPEITAAADLPEKEGQHFKHRGIRHYSNEIMKQEGFLGFWKGCTFDILKNGTYRIFHTLFLNLYEPLLNVDDPARRNWKTYISRFLMLFAVETSMQVIQHPFKVIRVRLAALENSKDPHTPRGFKRVGECVKRIWNEDGWRGFYRGFGTSLLEAVVKGINLSVQRYLAYKVVAEEEQNDSLIGNLGDVARERDFRTVVSAVLSVSGLAKKLKTISFQLGKHLWNVALLYPFRVIQRRIIMHKGGWRVKRTSVRQMIRDTWRREGLRGFYSGVQMQMLLNVGETIISPGVAAISGAVLPERVKAFASVGDVNQGTEAKFLEIKEKAEEHAEKIAEIAEKATERVEKLKDLAESAKEQVEKLAQAAEKAAKGNKK